MNDEMDSNESEISASGDDKEETDRDDASEDESPDLSRKAHNLITGHDVGEKRTVFLRNLSFDSAEADLKSLMEERFGKVTFARLVLDKLTEHPKGTAFVKFEDSESASSCVEASEADPGLFLDDRRIFACTAVTKSDADAMVAKKKAKEAKDSRNLHLAVEGLVRKGTKAAEGVSESDMKKRLQVEKWKRGMLKNLNMFVSPVRLCVRNIPPHYNDQQLKKLFLKHADPNCRITEAKIMRDMSKLDAKGIGTSKGYGFVAFERHEHALQALRNMNNNPSVFRKEARPIIEFSVENKKAVNARKKRLQKSRENNPTLGKKTSKVEKGGFKRKEKKDEVAHKPDYMGAINNPKQRKLPSHVGEKVRHNRPVQKISRKAIRRFEKEKRNPQKRKGGQAKPGLSTLKGPSLEQNDAKEKNPKKRRRKEDVKDLREEKKFMSLVEKYRSNLRRADLNTTKRKWFDN